MKKKVLAMLMGVMMVLGTACGPNSDESSEDAAASTTAKTDDSTTESSEGIEATTGLSKDEIKVGFVYIGEIDDQGYTQAHDKGRLALEADGIECAYMENVPENEDSETAIRELIESGCNVIYATSFNYMDYTIAVAEEYPDVYFGHATGYKTLDNLSTYMGKVEEPRYLSGIAAGLKTKTNKIGYVAAMQISEVIRGINAFTLGVQSVNPNATVEVIWTGNWYDPALEKQVAQQLLNNGCDVIAQHQDSTAAQLAAEEVGAFAIGYNTPTPDAAPKAYLTAPLFHWEVFYVDDVQRIIDGTWTTTNYWEGMSTGMVSLDTLTANCAEGTDVAIADAQEKIISGDLSIFAGPILNQSGVEKVAEGVTMTDDEVWNMNWFVQGVIGKID